MTKFLLPIGEGKTLFRNNARRWEEDAAGTVSAVDLREEEEEVDHIRHRRGGGRL
ncbi:hypothetical protein [Rhizobiales bacterium 3FA27D7]|uniref:hypothetical protein n=1 Tax=Mesorhizobium sp. 2RAF21 TaxID=3232995 RepID=UPI0014855F6B